MQVRSQKGSASHYERRVSRIVLTAAAVAVAAAAVPDLGRAATISKTDAPDPVTVGGNLTYRIDVSPTPNTDTALVLTDSLPANTTFVSVSTTGGICGVAAGVLTCFNLPENLASIVTLVVNVTSMPNGGTLSNTAQLNYCMTVFCGFTAIATATTTVTPNTAVLVRTLTATRSARGAVVRWRTASEIGILGFNVHRQENTNRVRVNSKLIAAKGGGFYSFLDRRSFKGKGVRYFIQLVNVDGSRSWYGPARVLLHPRDTPRTSASSRERR